MRDSERPEAVIERLDHGEDEEEAEPGESGHDRHC
jgi:hypothetical protein